MLDIPKTTPDAGALDIEQPDMSITDVLSQFITDFTGTNDLEAATQHTTTIQTTDQTTNQPIDETAIQSSTENTNQSNAQTPIQNPIQSPTYTTTESLIQALIEAPMNHTTIRTTSRSSLRTPKPATGRTSSRVQCITISRRLIVVADDVVAGLPRDRRLKRDKEVLSVRIDAALQSLKKDYSIYNIVSWSKFIHFNRRIEWSTPSYLHENPLFTNASFKSRMINTSGALDGKHESFV